MLVECMTVKPLVNFFANLAMQPAAGTGVAILTFVK